MSIAGMMLALLSGVLLIISAIEDLDKSGLKMGQSAWAILGLGSFWGIAAIGRFLFTWGN